jgi:hypothetical protein
VVARRKSTTLAAEEHPHRISVRIQRPSAACLERQTRASQGLSWENKLNKSFFEPHKTFLRDRTVSPVEVGKHGSQMRNKAPETLLTN